MAYTAREMDKGEIDPGSMRKSAELAMSELSINEELNTDWQHAACSLLVALGSQLPDMVQAVP
jgi:hypothetical protein